MLHFFTSEHIIGLSIICSIKKENQAPALILPGMPLTLLQFRIGRGSNPQPFDREPSTQPLDYSFCFYYYASGSKIVINFCSLNLNSKSQELF